MFNDELKSNQLLIDYEKFETFLDKKIVIKNWREIELPYEKAKLLSPIEVNVFLEKGKNQIFINGNVEAMLQIHCSRCLKPIEYWIDETFSSVYMDKRYEKFLSKSEQLKSLDNIIYYDGITIDLTNRVIETIISSVPIIPLCKEDCKGLCPICGADLNENPDHNCENEETDPRFSELKKLLEQGNF